MHKNASGKAASATEADSITLIQCTDSKRQEPSKAKLLYDKSTYFCKMRDYAEAKGNPWFILSAKHGLVHPETELEPYDAFSLSEQQATEIATEIASMGVCTVRLVAGWTYTNPLIPELEQHGVDVIELCAGLSIGERMQRLGELTAELENKSLC